MANIKKASVVRAEWAAMPVRGALMTPKARAAFAYLLEHNAAYAHYVTEQEREIAEGFPHGHRISAYGLLMKMPGVECAARPVLYPRTGYGDTDLRERLYELGLAGPGKQLSIRNSFLRKALSRCRAYGEDFLLAFLLTCHRKSHQMKLLQVELLFHHNYFQSSLHHCHHYKSLAQNLQWLH